MRAPGICLETEIGRPDSDTLAPVRLAAVSSRVARIEALWASPDVARFVRSRKAGP